MNERTINRIANKTSEDINLRSKLKIIFKIFE